MTLITHFDDSPSTPTRQIASDPRASRDSSVSPKTSLTTSLSPARKYLRHKRSFSFSMTAQPEADVLRRSAASPIPPWKISETNGRSPTFAKSKSPSVPSHGIDSPGHLHNAPQDQIHSRSSFSNKNVPPAINLATRRRQSRFDPMGRDDETEEDTYGELGQRHPLRRVAEEDGKEEPTVSLPSIKSLFGVAGEHPPTPASASMYSSTSLPSLVANSPSSSPQTARTSRYSSVTSQISSVSDTFQPGPGGWWAPEFERTPSSASGSPRHPGAYRANSFPSVQPFIDEHADKRRRSDGPPPLRDAEESARLRWQAQSRNASFPITGQHPSTSAQGSGSGLRSLLHPPSATSALARGSISASPSYSSPLAPFQEHPGAPGEFPFERRIAPVPSRSSSIVGGLLAQSFADLSASERGGRSPLTEMAPPSIPDRRPSALQPVYADGGSARGPLQPLSLSRPPSTAPISRSSSMDPGQDALRRQAVTRPASPDVASSGPPRRSSLTEAIMAKSGDGAAMASGRLGLQSAPQSAPLEKPNLSGPRSATVPIITGWPVRRDSADSIVSREGISLNSDPDSKTPSQRGTKRSQPREEEDEDVAGDHAMRGMEVLAESARRVQEAERDHDGSDASPPRSQHAASGPLHGNMVMGQGGAGPKYACAYCPKTFSRPSSLRIHTYSHTGERPFVCKEPSCRRRFSVQSNLKRHAKVHQMGGQAGSAPNNQFGHPHPHDTTARPIERSHRHPVPPHTNTSYYHLHHPHSNLSHQGQALPPYQHYPSNGYERNGADGPARPRFVANGQEREQGPHDDAWEDEEDELEEDELDDEPEEAEK